MSNITFDTEGKTQTEKEDIEWLRIWCEETNDTSLPRVALVGDSITEGYFRFVSEKLKGIARVDVLATSYSITSKMYIETVKNFIADSQYAIVHYNYGLHAYRVGDDDYEQGCKALIGSISHHAKVVVGTTTIVVDSDLKTESAHWKDKVKTRNERLVKVAKEGNFPIDDLNVLSCRLLGDNRAPDGVHFSEKGYMALAESVAESIKGLL